MYNLYAYSCIFCALLCAGHMRYTSARYWDVRKGVSVSYLHGFSYLFHLVLPETGCRPNSMLAMASSSSEVQAADAGMIKGEGDVGGVVLPAAEALLKMIASLRESKRGSTLTSKRQESV